MVLLVVAEEGRGIASLCLLISLCLARSLQILQIPQIGNRGKFPGKSQSRPV